MAAEIVAMADANAQEGRNDAQYLHTDSRDNASAAVDDAAYLMDSISTVPSLRWTDTATCRPANI